MKRIAMFIHHEVGGAVQAFYGFMKILQKHDYRIDLYRFNHAGESFLPLSQMVENTYDYEVNVRGRVQGGRFPLIREYVNTFRFWTTLRRLDRVSREMAEEIDSRGYDFTFVHVDKFVKNPHLLKYLQTPTFYYLQEPQRKFYDPDSLFRDELQAGTAGTHWSKEFQELWYKPARLMYDHIQKSTARKNLDNFSFTVLANSYFSLESIYRAYDVLPVVCYLAVDERFKPLNLPRKDFVLTVGSLTPNKGHAFIVRALSRIPISLRPKFVVVSDRTSSRRRKNLIECGERLGVEVEVREQVAWKELKMLYATARLFVYGSRLEPFGLAPLEAMAMKLPVVAIKSGGVRETVADQRTGLLTDYDVHDFASQVTRLLQDDGLWRSFSEAGPAYIEEQWTWERTFQRFEQIIQREGNQ